MPSMVHIGHPTLGHAWFTNRELAIKIAEEIGVKIPFDDIFSICCIRYYVLVQTKGIA